MFPGIATPEGPTGTVVVVLVGNVVVVDVVVVGKVVVVVLVGGVRGVVVGGVGRRAAAREAELMSGTMSSPSVQTRRAIRFMTFPRGRWWGAASVMIP
jgi:hypothetical protein